MEAQRCVTDGWEKGKRELTASAVDRATAERTRM